MSCSYYPVLSQISTLETLTPHSKHSQPRHPLPNKLSLRRCCRFSLLSTAIYCLESRNGSEPSSPPSHALMSGASPLQRYWLAQALIFQTALCCRTSPISAACYSWSCRKGYFPSLNQQTGYEGGGTGQASPLCPPHPSGPLGGLAHLAALHVTRLSFQWAPTMTLARLMITTHSASTIYAESALLVLEDFILGAQQKLILIPDLDGGG